MMQYDWTGVEHRRRMVMRSSFAIATVLVVATLTVLGVI
ncbi:hypothetical protein J2858_002134 [Neorhizobium galegae]|nr:hypothetical protein [Neorhizobium galegae]